MKYKELRQFKPEELLFDEAETRVVLKFIFKPTDHPLIDSLPMSDALREFAQGLLIEAIDASYAVGFVHAIWRSSANPTKGAVEILKRFAVRASLHWFEHATAHNLVDVKVYQFVLDRLAETFRDPLHDFVATLNKRRGAFVAYQKPEHGILRAWG